ncbi:MAG: RNase P subunit p30 family protein [Candidatus Woesearchaeota archaeon]
MDIVFPNNNEKEFLEIAEWLGTNELLLAYPLKRLEAVTTSEGFIKLIESSKVKIRVGIIAEPKEVQLARKEGITVLCRALAKPADRWLFEKAKPDIIFDLEQSPEPDSLHQRNSGLNHVLAAIAAKNRIAIGFSFASILNSSGTRRAQLLGRIAQNTALCKKYDVKCFFASFASSPWEMRGEHELKAIGELIGFSLKQNL